MLHQSVLSRGSQTRMLKCGKMARVFISIDEEIQSSDRPHIEYCSINGSCGGVPNAIFLFRNISHCLQKGAPLEVLLSQ